jgi:hypothetical protein
MDWMDFSCKATPISMATTVFAIDIDCDPAAQLAHGFLHGGRKSG